MFRETHVRPIDIVGNRRILITDYDCKNLGMNCYTGEVKLCGLPQLPGRKATIFCFEDNVAQCLHDRLVSVSHPHILGSLGHGQGLGSYSHFSQFPFSMLHFPPIYKAQTCLFIWTDTQMTLSSWSAIL